MNILLLVFFALPVAIIILSAVLETFIKCPIKVAAIFFSIFLVVAVAIGDEILLLAVIIYTILSFISAFITRLILNRRENICQFPYQLANDTNQSENQCSCGCQNRYLDISNNGVAQDNVEVEYYRNLHQNLNSNYYQNSNNSNDNTFYKNKKNFYR